MKEWLFVLDDVKSAILLRVSKVFMTNCVSFIIITRSNAVVKFLRNILLQTLIVKLEKFSDEDCREILRRRC